MEAITRSSRVQEIALKESRLGDRSEKNFLRSTLNGAVLIGLLHFPRASSLLEYICPTRMLQHRTASPKQTQTIRIGGYCALCLSMCHRMCVLCFALIVALSQLFLSHPVLGVLDKMPTLSILCLVESYNNS